MAHKVPDLTHAKFGGDFRYTILGPIGDGGWAWVYRAMDHRLSREVAIKFLRPPDDLHEAQTMRERFEQEARICAQLNSRKHIVDVFEYGTCTIREREYHYLSMELVRGETLFDYLRTRGTLNERETRRLLAQVAIALKEAHSHDLIHRDLKPENLMILEDESLNVVVLDFGIAKSIQREDAEQKWKSNFTMQDEILCSPIYAAPEQIKREALGGYTDLYALGVVAFEAMTGRHPYRNEQGEPLPMYEFMAKLVMDPSWRLPAPYDTWPVAALIHALIQKEVSERMGSADELLKRLDALDGVIQEDLGALTIELATPEVQTERLDSPVRHPQPTLDLLPEAQGKAISEYVQTTGMRAHMKDELTQDYLTLPREAVTPEMVAAYEETRDTTARFIQATEAPDASEAIEALEMRETLHLAEQTEDDRVVESATPSESEEAALTPEKESIPKLTPSLEARLPGETSSVEREEAWASEPRSSSRLLTVAALTVCMVGLAALLVVNIITSSDTAPDAAMSSRVAAPSDVVMPGVEMSKPDLTKNIHEASLHVHASSVAAFTQSVEAHTQTLKDAPSRPVASRPRPSKQAPKEEERMESPVKVPKKKKETSAPKDTTSSASRQGEAPVEPVKQPELTQAERDARKKAEQDRMRKALKVWGK